MQGIQIAYRLRTLFEQKVTAEYYNSFKGSFGRVQVEVLSCLYARERIRVQELADALNVPKQHASKILSRLEAQALVTKVSDPQDGRSMIYSLRQEGRVLMEEHLAVSDRCFSRRMARLNPDEQKKMLQAMQTVAELLEKM